MRRQDSDLQISAAESNELLNGSEMKMKEFDRVDSEDDILEEYGNECPRPHRCVRERSGLEKFLFLLFIVCIIIIIALAVTLGSKHNISESTKCENQDCIEAAASILSSMDQSVDPCDDFYQYACGGWVANNPPPPGYPLWDRFQQLSYQNLYHMKTLIETTPTRTTTGMKIKRFYDSCMSESKRIRVVTLNDFRSLLHNVSAEGDPNWDLILLLENIHSYNSWPLFSVLVGPDERDTNKNMIKIDLGEHKYPFSVHEQPLPTTAPPDVNTTSGDKMGYVTLDSNKYPRWNSSAVERNFIRDMVRILKVFWNKTDAEASSISQELLILEKSLSLTLEGEIHIHNRSHVYNVMKIVDLQTKCDIVDWTLYIERMLKGSVGQLSNSWEITVLHEDTLIKICKIVDTYMNNPQKKSILRLYLVTHLVQHLMPYFEADTFEPDIDYLLELELDGEHWRRCVHHTNKALGFGTGAMYVHGMKKQSSVKKIKILVDDVKKAFKDYLLRKIWLDSNTKKEASQKLDEMLEKISYPEYILEPKFLDDYYKKLDIGDDWFRNVLQWQEFKVSHMMSQLGNRPDRSSWINPPITVASDYSPVRNDIIFPIALFHIPFYAENGPPAMNFGAIGSVIGHEITHAFDIQGRQYDGKGRLREWWNPLTVSQFRKTTSCMKSQYDQYSVDGLFVNGDLTLDENIADNGGLRAAFIAYQLWERDHGKDPALPGFNLTNRQMFFISYAQMFCSKWSSGGLFRYMVADPHSPGPIRVRGSISNTDAFAKEFRCPFISNYNPSRKCEVW